MKPTICFFGIYDPTYSRNQVLAQGFEANGFEVISCQVDPRQYPGLTKYWQLIKAWYRLKTKVDWVLAAYPGQTVVPLARLFSPRHRLIFDAFTSLYDSNVDDRRLYSRYSLGGLRDWCLDWLGLHLADQVITDTLADGDYFVSQFGVSASKISRVFVGTAIKFDENLATKPDPSGTFLVHFHGTFIPLQGIEYIIRAAKILEAESNIRFRIIGDGQESGKITKIATDLQLNNVEFLPRMPFSQLIEKMAEADVVLGIFGTSSKSSRVIPNKVFEGLAQGKAIITAGTPALRELLTDQENVLFCRAGDPADLAAKILALKNSPPLNQALAKAAKKLFSEKLSPRSLVLELAVLLEKQK
jgi:glycosyltransferase involved in cell wall biosynthesis